MPTRYDDVREIMREVAKDAKFSRAKLAEATKISRDETEPEWKRAGYQHAESWWKSAYFAQKAIWYRLYYNHL